MRLHSLLVGMLSAPWAAFIGLAIAGCSSSENRTAGSGGTWGDTKREAEAGSGAASGSRAAGGASESGGAATDDCAPARDLFAGRGAITQVEEGDEIDPATCAVEVAGTCVRRMDRSKSEVCARLAADYPARATACWQPGSGACDGGTHPSSAIEDALRRWNLYRWLSRLQPVTASAEGNAKAQACAIIQATQGELSHYPPAAGNCATPLGVEASAESSLANSETAAEATDVFIHDPGDANRFSLGHRRWLLLPLLREVGVGVARVNGYSAACHYASYPGVDGPGGFVDLVGHPAAGIFPIELLTATGRAEPARLSFSVFDWDLAGAQVSMFEESPSGDQPLEIESYGLDGTAHTIGIGIEPRFAIQPETTYRVDVSGTTVGLVRIRTRLVSCTKPALVPAPPACEIGGQACPSDDQACYPQGDGVACFVPGTATLGAPCAQHQDCAAGMACDGASGQCRMLCKPLKGLRPPGCELCGAPSPVASYSLCY